MRFAAVSSAGYLMSNSCQKTGNKCVACPSNRLESKKGSVDKGHAFMKIQLAIALIAVASPAYATFHMMQIEQVIGGVDGDTSAQAIQLRMRSAGENLVSQARLVAFDATGAN